MTYIKLKCPSCKRLIQDTIYCVHCGTKIGQPNNKTKKIKIIQEVDVDVSIAEIIQKLNKKFKTTACCSGLRKDHNNYNSEKSFPYITLKLFHCPIEEFANEIGWEYIPASIGLYTKGWSEKDFERKWKKLKEKL